MALKNFSRESFCKRINHVLLGGDFCYCNVSSMYDFPERWYFRLMCFPHLWLLGSREFATAPLLPQYKVIGRCIFRTTSKSVKNFLSHTASFPTSQSATYYSASIVESAIHDCFMFLNTTAPPFRVKTDPDTTRNLAFNVGLKPTLKAFNVTWRPTSL